MIQQSTKQLYNKGCDRACVSVSVRVCVCVYPECSRLVDNTTLSRCSAPQLKRKESFSCSLDRTDTYKKNQKTKPQLTRLVQIKQIT